MNTPRKIKRHNRKIPDNGLPDGGYVGSITDREIAAELGMLAADFVHLEEKMADILSVLLGTTDVEMSGYVLRAIKSPRGRVDLLKNLLELAPANKNRPESFDDAISEFWNLNLARNDYIHGEWWSHAEGRTFISIFDPHGLGFFTAREIKKEELQAVRERIGKHLYVLINLGISERKRTQPPKPSRQSPEHD